MVAKIFSSMEKARAYADRMNKKARKFVYVCMDYRGHKGVMVIKRRKR